MALLSHQQTIVDDVWFDDGFNKNRHSIAQEHFELYWKGNQLRQKRRYHQTTLIEISPDGK